MYREKYNAAVKQYEVDKAVWDEEIKQIDTKAEHHGEWITREFDLFDKAISAFQQELSVYDKGLQEYQQIIAAESKKF